METSSLTTAKSKFTISTATATSSKSSSVFSTIFWGNNFTRKTFQLSPSASTASVFMFLIIFSSFLHPSHGQSRPPLINAKVIRGAVARFYNNLSILNRLLM